MKRKITKGLLLAAIIFGSTSTFVSCKDYESDVVADLQTQNDDLSSLLNSKITELSNLQNALKDSCSVLRDSIENFPSLYLSSSINGVVYDNIQDLAKALSDSINANKQLPTGGITVDGITYTDLSSAVVAMNAALKKSNFYDNNYDFSKFVTLGKLYGVVDSLGLVIETAKQAAIDAAYDSIGSVVDSIKVIDTKILNINTLIDTQVATINKDIASVLGKATQAQKLAEDDSIRIDDIKIAVDGKADTAIVNKLSDGIMNIDTRVRVLESDIKGAKIAAQDALDRANEVLAEANSYSDALYEAAKVELKNYTDLKVSDLETAMKAADKVLGDSLKLIDDKANDLLSKYEAIDKKLSKLVTGIIIQATENPVIGSASFPIGVNTNILAAYYGFAGSYNVVFPTNATRNYVNAEEASGFTPLIGGEQLAAAGSQILDGAGNAGTLYLTVNPNTVDFTGLSFQLVDSKDNPAPGYAPLVFTKCNDKTLGFGYTRSAVNNGFYSAKATVTDASQAKVTIDVNSLKTAAKEIITNRTSADLSTVASSLLKTFNSVNNIPAYAVKCTWNDGVEEHSVYSNYAIAATAVKPLSFGFLKDGQKRFKLPTIASLEERGYIFDHFTFDPITSEPISITLRVPKGVKIAKPTVTINTPNVKVGPISATVEIEDISAKIEAITPNGTWNPDGSLSIDPISPNITINKPKVSVDVTSPDVDVDIDDPIINFTDPVITYTDTTITITQVQAIIDGMNGQISGMMSNINGLVDKVNSTVELADSYIAKVNKVLNKLNNVLEDPNSKLQICMLYENGAGGTSQLNTNKTWPSYFKLGGNTEAGITISPTSYTAELFAPAFKKYIAVTKVWNADGTVNDAARDYANAAENMNKVIPGSTRKLIFQTRSAYAGCTYEIAYSAVDYSGMITTRKFYVKVVK